MGYCTDHNLTVRKIKSEERFKELLDYMKSKDLIHYAFDDGRYNEKRHEAEFLCYDSVKWYNHTVDMLHIAEKFPEMYFELEGNGEDFGDFWKEYYHDMDIEYCRGEIVYEQPKKVQWQQLIAF